MFLRDWQPGDVVSAADMQALVDAVAMLESAADTRGGAKRGARRRISDGPQGWPWQVMAVPGEDGIELRVVRGKVLAGVRWLGPGDGADDGRAEFSFMELPADDGAEVVQDYDDRLAEVTVYLELTGRVERRPLTVGDKIDAGVLDGDGYDSKQGTGHEVVELADARLRVTCEPVAGALRVWPLAVVNKTYAQPVTQLQWGDLNALECRGIARGDTGELVWPSDRSAAAPWGSLGHAAGMDCAASFTFVNGQNEARGDLKVCMDEDGAVEFYIGPYEEPGGESSGDSAPEPDDDENDEAEGAPPPGPFYPVPPGPAPGPTPTPVPKITKVQYGYVAGEGFLGCQLVKAADGQLYWELELDPLFLSRACAGMEVPATVTYRAEGTQEGTTATVEMGLGDCAASASGMLLRGTAQLVFHGSNDVDASRKTATVNVNYVASPVWEQGRKWYLSTKKVHRAGAYVRMDRARPGWQPGGFIEANVWYKFSVKREKYRDEMMQYLKQKMSAMYISDRDECVRFDSKVAAVLSNTLTAPVVGMTLSDID